MTFESFCQDDKTIDAVIRNLEIIGEAGGYVPEEIRTRYPTLLWSEMGGMRNILAHAYFRVSLCILCQATVHDLSPLIPLLQEILDSEA